MIAVVQRGRMFQSRLRRRGPARAIVGRAVGLLPLLLLAQLPVAGGCAKQMPVTYNVGAGGHSHEMDGSAVWVEPFVTGGRGPSGEQVAAAVRTALGEENMVTVARDPDGYVIRGRIDQASLDTNQWADQWRDKDGNHHTSYNVRKAGSMNGSYELWRGEEMICGDNVSANFSKDNSGGSHSEAAAGLPSDSAVMQEMLGRLAQQIKMHAVPHKQHGQLEVVAVRHPAGKQGMTHLQHGDPADALEYFQQAATAATAPGDKAAALYMSGVCYEMQQNLVEAVRCYDEAFALHPKPLYVKAHKRVKDLQSKAFSQSAAR